METLVSTVLIIVIFMVSSLILNNLFSNTVRNNTRSIATHLNELEYLYLNEKLLIPYMDDYDGWTISVTKENINNSNVVEFLAVNPTTHKVVKINSYQ